MIDVDAAAVIVRFAHEIQLRALPLDLWPDKVSPKQARARNGAWRLLVKLQRFMQHTEESDLALLLLEKARRQRKEKEAERLVGNIRYEDNGYRKALADLETTLNEVVKDEKDDPTGEIYGAKIAKVNAERQASADDEEVARKQRRNAATAGRRAAKKGVAVAV